MPARPGIYAWYFDEPPPGELVTNRRRHRRHKEARLNFNPQLLFSINWATSGPGFEWPEAYYVTYVPGLEKYVFTASRDGDDAWGCADHAIGSADKTDGLQEAARKVLTSYWKKQADGWDQQRWERCIAEGLVDERAANAWAQAVWAEDTAIEDADDEQDGLPSREGRA